MHGCQTNTRRGHNAQKHCNPVGVVCFLSAPGMTHTYATKVWAFEWSSGDDAATTKKNKQGERARKRDKEIEIDKERLKRQTHTHTNHKNLNLT